MRLERRTTVERTLALAGAASVGAAVLLAGYLAADSWTAGAVGFWLLLALPGLALVVRSTGIISATWLLPLMPVAFILLGLDVTDSARPGVVLAGYAVAVLAGVAALAATVMLHKRGRTAACAD